MIEVECKHESWDCTGPSDTYIAHHCNDCEFYWTTSDGPGWDNCALCSPQKFVTKDSGKREEYDSGMVRDTQENKPRFDLLYPLGVPYEHQFLVRVAELLARGAEKYEDRNWEKANGQAELDRFKASAHRHLSQWMVGESDEDHAAGTVFNLLAYETIKWKLDNP